MKKLLLLSAVAALALLPLSAKADSFHADTFDQPNGFQDVSVTVGPLTETVRAGEIRLRNTSVNPEQDLLVWCLDLMDLLTTPYTFTETTLLAGQPHPGLAAMTAGQIRQIASLMIGGLTLGGADLLQDDAATQLAIWSVVYGNQFSTTASGALLNRMNLELADSLPGQLLDCPTCSITVLTDAVTAPNQALGFATQAVAVPGPILGGGVPGLVAAGMFLVGLGRRRRKNAAA